MTRFNMDVAVTWAGESAMVCPHGWFIVVLRAR